MNQSKIQGILNQNELRKRVVTFSGEVGISQYIQTLIQSILGKSLGIATTIQDNWIL